MFHNSKITNLLWNNHHGFCQHRGFQPFKACGSLRKKWELETSLDLKKESKNWQVQMHLKDVYTTFFNTQSI